MDEVVELEGGRRMHVVRQDQDSRGRLRMPYGFARGFCARTRGPPIYGQDLLLMYVELSW